jgi:hypothetical protein
MPTGRSYQQHITNIISVLQNFQRLLAIMSNMLYPTPYAMLTSYCLSGALMEHFAIYPGWAALSLSHPSSTPSIPKIAPLITAHSSQSLAIVYIYALPKVLVTGCIIAQLVHEQTGNPLVQSRNVGNQLAQ